MNIRNSRIPRKMKKQLKNGTKGVLIKMLNYETKKYSKYILVGVEDINQCDKDIELKRTEIKSEK